MFATLSSLLAGVEDGADAGTSGLLWTILVVLVIIVAIVWLLNHFRR